jgi:hypothetical protein
MITHKKSNLIILLIFYFSGVTPTFYSQPGVTTQVKVINISDLQKIVSQNEDRALIINLMGYVVFALP